MWRSFGNGGMGGGASGSGGMLRAVRIRATVGGGLQDPVTIKKPTSTKPTTPNSYNTNVLTLSTHTRGGSSVNNNQVLLSSPTSSASVSNASSSRYSSSCSYLYDSTDEWEWETVNKDGEENKDDLILSNGYYDIFGAVPSMDEVRDAVSSLQQFSSAGSDEDWVEPALHVNNPRTLRSHGYERVYTAFHLLQTDPSVQRMVVSLSTDKALWDAVLNNEAVQELRESFRSAESGEELRSSEEGLPLDEPKNMLKWMLEETKGKFIEFVEKITSLLSAMFQPQEKEPEVANDMFEDTLRSSLFLSVMVLMVVVITRAQRT
ncbi:hypothetical protein MKX03_017801 [Papaver bracteatum]|nr:hypothetical protein MKX03_017801 [Papaver bracteatum]